MSILSEHFSRFPGFSDAIRTTSPQVWSAVQEAIALEGGLAGATRGAASKVPTREISKAAL